MPLTPVTHMRIVKPIILLVRMAAEQTNVISKRNCIVLGTSASQLLIKGSSMGVLGKGFLVNLVSGELGLRTVGVMRLSKRP